MEHFIIGFAVFFNGAVILMKLNLARYFDAAFDTAFLVALSYVFGGSFDGLVASTVASALMSIFLFFYRPKFLDEIRRELS